MFVFVIASFILLYVLACVYTTYRGWTAIYPNLWVRVTYLLVTGLILPGYLIARFTDAYLPDSWTLLLYRVGSLGMGFVFYATLLFLIHDVAYLIVKLLSVYLIALQQLPQLLRKSGPWFVWAIAGCLVTYGYWNATHPIKNEITITVNEPLLETWRFAVVSDIHMGELIRQEEVRALVQSINQANPDAVLLLGDMIDNDAADLIRSDPGLPLRQIKAPFGVFGITGNHEYISHVDQSVAYLEGLGVTMLRDEAYLLGDSIYLVGREDHSRIRFIPQERQPLELILDGVDRSKPIVVLDHQPVQYQLGPGLGVDLWLSGHTHAGQMWPLNFLTQAIYGESEGVHQIDDMAFILSTGYGTWGPRVRVGHRPEWILLTIQSKHSEIAKPPAQSP